MVSEILWQLVDFGSASNELYPPVVSKITNIFKMFSALGKGNQALLALWVASCCRSKMQPLSLSRREKGEWGMMWEQAPVTERPERSVVSGHRRGPVRGRMEGKARVKPHGPPSALQVICTQMSVWGAAVFPSSW